MSELGERFAAAAAAITAGVRAWEASMMKVADAIALFAERVGVLQRLIVEDPFDWRPRTFRETLVQMRDVILHEFWMAADRPARSPGARWVRR